MQNVIAKTDFTAQELAKKIKLKIVYDPQTTLVISTPNVNRVGLQLTGYFEYFANERVQVIGPSEVHFLDTLTQEDKQRVVSNFFKNSFPCIVFSRDLKVDDIFVQCAKQKGVAIFSSNLSTSELISEVVENLKEMQALTIQEHGVLMDIDGVGVMIKGSSGIGKSEIALELLRRGHRIVADDIVVIKRIGNMLDGSANPLVKNFMELRGVGLVNIVRLYGASSIKLNQEIELIIELENWDNSKTYERLGGEPESEDILGISLTKMTIPVSPGRNVAVVIETAANVYRLSQMGYNAMDELTERMKNQ
ncbi:MAG: HPr(Ser) kinase/phosphatase [Clostridiales bacterium]|nr:HPr(Ser) kinase/phosphatase [Clostridiales bacterium]